jgi:asparagine synthase (glutamine-hydrolysing)
VCGIVGFVHLTEPGEFSHEHAVLTNMLGEISERGPDGHGVWHGGCAHFGHCRLAIIDLSEASCQPMRLDNGEFVIVYNGEIYNFEALREELLGEGEQFFSSGDTEVLLRGFRRFGVDWLVRLNGMFAGAVWNKREQKLTLFRDRFGIKPLYWTVVDGTVLFASQIKSFRKYPQFRSKFSLHWLNEYLTFQTVHGASTPFEGVQLLEPGQSLEFRVGGTAPKRINWVPQRKYEPDSAISIEEATDLVSKTFSQAVENTLVSDVPVGAYLSGGIDSGAIVAVASKFETQMKTFSCGFDENGLSERTRAANEVNLARELSDITGTSFHQISLKPADAMEMHRGIFRTLEEPRVGVLYQNNLVAKFASTEVKVCLSGAGGDELFGGYPWRYRTMRNATNREEFLSGYYQYWQRVYTDKEKRSLYLPHLLNELDPDTTFELFCSQFPKGVDYREIGVKTWLCLKYESELFLHGLLQIGDRLAGAYGMEERFPFLDNNLVSVLDTIPAGYHWDASEEPVDGQYYSGKKLLRRALSNLVPNHITNRVKQGFVIPAKEWFEGPLMELIRSELLNQNARINEFFQPGAVERAIMSNANGTSISGAQIWSLLSVEAILKEFFN